MVHRHTIHKHEHHVGWNSAFSPVLRFARGESVEFEVYEASGGQPSPASTVNDVGRMDFDRVNPVTGPVFIHGAEPGGLGIGEIVDVPDWTGSFHLPLLVFE